MRIYILLFALLHGVLSIKAAENPKNTALKSLQKQADKLFSSKMYFAAIPFYHKLYSKQSDAQSAWNLSECYWNLGYYDSAVIYMQKANLNPKMTSERLAEYYIKTGNYALAEQQLEQAARYAEQNEKSYFLNKRASLLNRSSLLKDSADWSVAYLSFNTSAREYAPSLVNGELFFISNRDAGFIVPKTNSKDGLPYDGVYKAGRINELIKVHPVWVQKPSFKYNNRYLIDLTPLTSNDNNLLQAVTTLQTSTPSASMLPRMLKTAVFKGHVGPVNITSSGQEIYFTRTSRRKVNGVYQLEVCKSVKKGNEWSAPTVLTINDSSASTFHPYYDESTQTLYFASDKSGGMGGSDIYKSNLQSDGSWSAPINLGDKFNTIKDEGFPFVASNRLYFSSNGWPGLGGTDIFYSELNGNDSAPKNVGYPVNSASDDYSIVFSGDKSTGYFSTNRYGSDDILSFTYATKLITVKSAVTNQATGLRQSGVKVVLEQKDASGNWRALDTYVTNHKGTYEFKARPNESNYRFRLTGDELAAEDQFQYFSTEGVTASKELESFSVNVKEDAAALASNTGNLMSSFMTKKTSSVDNRKGTSFRIYHYFNSTGYVLESHDVLMEIRDLMLSDQNVRITISSAADCFGNTKSNLKLSEERAKFIQSLFPHNVRDRIQVEWIGNSKPIKPCDIKTRTFASEQINRYTLITIL